MLFYADKHREIERDAALQAIAQTLTLAAEAWPTREVSSFEWSLCHYAALVGAAIALGEIHQAVADSLCRDADGAFPETDLLADAGALIGRCVYRSWEILRGTAPGNVKCGTSAPLLRRSISADGQSSSPTALPDLLAAASTSVARVETMDLPARLEVKVPEGYAFYSLFPEMYFCSLHRLLQADPEIMRYTVVGIRSIGTSLATLVAGALIELGLIAHVETVRPRGHPFERFIYLASSLQRRLAEACGSSSFLVVDEGPGLTCSSLLSVCSALKAVGAPEGRVTVLSAWRGVPSIYASDDLRSRWASQRVIYTDAADAFDGWKALLPFVERSLGRDCMATEATAIEDLSYGRWREYAYPSPDRWPVVHRSTERTKLLISLGDGGASQRPTPNTQYPAQSSVLGPRTLVFAKFTGLGDYGKEKLSRAESLAAAGFSAPVAGTAYGFLLQPYIEGRPLAVSDLCEPLIDRIVAYYAFVARSFALPPAPRFDMLAQMMRLNAREAIGVDASDHIDLWRQREDEIDRLQLVQIDGRPFPHEWLELTDDGQAVYLKTDSADHFRDHTLVGEQNVLWDLAGACEEWEMSPSQVACFLELWKAETGDDSAKSLLSFFRTAYLSFRTAELHYAIHSTNEEEVRRNLQHEQWKTNRRLTERLKAEN